MGGNNDAKGDLDEAMEAAHELGWGVVPGKGGVDGDMIILGVGALYIGLIPYLLLVVHLLSKILSKNFSSLCCHSISTSIPKMTFSSVDRGLSR